jgi:hypothetical protein
MNATDIRAAIARFEAAAAELSEIAASAVLPHKPAANELTRGQLGRTNAMLAALADEPAIPQDDSVFDLKANEAAAGLASTAAALTDQFSGLPEKLHATRATLLRAGVADESAPHPLDELAGKVFSTAIPGTLPSECVRWTDVPPAHVFREVLTESDLADVPDVGRVVAMPRDWRTRPYNWRRNLKIANAGARIGWRQEVTRRERAAADARQAEEESRRRQDQHERILQLEKALAVLKTGAAA